VDVLDALRGYVSLATGLTEVTVTKAREAAAALLTQGLDIGKVPDVPGKDSAVAAASQVQGLADDLLETSKQNREMLIGLIRTEVDRAAGRMGFVREEELAAVRRHVARLEDQVADLRTSRTGAPAVADSEPPAPAPVKKKIPVKRPVSPAPSDAAAATAEGAASTSAPEQES
jgi:hypothetical protein